jgi:hypothetical protein
MATEPTRTNRTARHKLITALAVGLAAAVMAIPAAVATGRAVPGGAVLATGPAATASDTTTVRPDGSKAAPLAGHVSPTATTVDSGNGFDWGDAMIGAGGAVALIAVIGAGGLTVVRRRHLEPAVPART